jgi:hypothetical protein
MLLYIILPGVVEDYNDRGMAVPQTLCLRHDGGGSVLLFFGTRFNHTPPSLSLTFVPNCSKADTMCAHTPLNTYDRDVDNKTHMSACYWLAQNKCFTEVRDDRSMKGHSHDDYDWAFMILLRWLKRRPGCGGMTPELLKDMIRQIPNCKVFVADRAYDFKAYFAGCPFKKLKHGRESLGKKYVLEDDGTVTVSVCPDPTASRAAWTVIGKGESGSQTSFFQAPPPTEPPALADPWSDDSEGAMRAQAIFTRAISNIQAKVSGVSGHVLARYKVPGVTVEAKREHVAAEWRKMLRQSPPAGGQMYEPELSLSWPPPFLDALRENRQMYGGGVAPLPQAAPAVEDDDAIGARSRARTTSRVPEVQEQIDILNQGEASVTQPGPVQVGAYHFVVDEHGGGLIWVGRIESINCRCRLDKSVSTTPGMLPSWARPKHHAKCGAKGVWTTTAKACTVATCPRATSCDIRWYAPADVNLTGEDQCVSAALLFAGGESRFIAPFLDSHFQTQANCPRSEVPMDYIGPVVEFHQSASSATKIKLKIESKRTYATIAAQLATAKHPGFSME